MKRIKLLIGESIWQSGFPVLSNKPTLQTLKSYQNPFSKALSSLTATDSIAGQSTTLKTTISKHSFDCSDISDSFDVSKKSVVKKPMKTLSLKPKT